MLRITLTFASLLASAALFTYPLFFVTFPWTVPVPYMAALIASLCVFIAGVCR